MLRSYTLSAFVITLSFVLFACEGSLFVPESQETTIRRSFAPERLYLNQGYDFETRSVTATTPTREPADVFLYFESAGSRFVIGTPLEHRIYELPLPSGTTLDDVVFVPTRSDVAYQERYEVSADTTYVVYTRYGYYAVLSVTEFENTGISATSYIVFEWKSRLDGLTEF